MAEHLEIAQGNKAEKYDTLYKQIVALTEGEPDIIARMANVAAMIHATFNFWWTGFYRVVDDVLVLSPFQGPLACINHRATLEVKGLREVSRAWPCSSPGRQRLFQDNWQ